MLVTATSGRFVLVALTLVKFFVSITFGIWMIFLIFRPRKREEKVFSISFLLQNGDQIEQLKISFLAFFQFVTLFLY